MIGANSDNRLYTDVKMKPTSALLLAFAAPQLATATRLDKAIAGLMSPLFASAAIINREAQDLTAEKREPEEAAPAWVWASKRDTEKREAEAQPEEAAPAWVWASKRVTEKREAEAQPEEASPAWVWASKRVNEKREAEAQPEEAAPAWVWASKKSVKA